MEHEWRAHRTQIRRIEADAEKNCQESLSTTNRIEEVIMDNNCIFSGKWEAMHDWIDRRSEEHLLTGGKGWCPGPVHCKYITRKWTKCKPITGGKGWCPGLVHHKYITRKWTKYQANTHPAHPKFIQNFPSQFSCNFPSPGNGQYIHSVPGHVTEISPLGKSWEHSKFSQRM